MVRKTLLGLLTCTLVVAPAFALDNSVNATVNVDVTSTYMWNGFDRVKASGLDEGPAVQPGVGVCVPNTGLSLNVGGSFVVNDNSELQELTYGVQFVRAVSPVVTVGAGYAYYDGRVSDVQGVTVPDQNDHEVWGRVTLSSSLGVTPGVTVKYETPTVEGADGYAVVVGSVGYAMPVRTVGTSGVGVNLDWNAGVIYNSGVKVNGVDVVNSGVSAVTAGVKAPVHVGRVVVTPSVNYQLTTEDTVKQLNGGESNQFWATVGVAYGF